MPIDQRFFTHRGSQSLRTLLRLCDIDVEVAGDPEISSVSAANTAQPGDLCFVEGGPRQAGETSPDASACFVKEGAASGLPDGVTAIIVDQPRYAHKLASEALFELKDWNADGPAPAID